VCGWAGSVNRIGTQSLGRREQAGQVRVGAGVGGVRDQCFDRRDYSVRRDKS